MRFRFASISLVVLLLVAALTPAALADAAAPRTYTLSASGGGGPPPIAWRASTRAPRQVSGLPWSRVWVPRNLHRNRGR